VLIGLAKSNEATGLHGERERERFGRIRPLDPVQLAG
jgi:hypothetical protein